MRILKKILYVLWAIIWWTVKAPFVFIWLVLLESLKPSTPAQKAKRQRENDEWDEVVRKNNENAVYQKQQRQNKYSRSSW